MSVSRRGKWATIQAHLRADPRKTGALAVLIVAMVIMYVRVFWKSSSPEDAEASAAAVVEEQQDPQTAPVPAGLATGVSVPRVTLAQPLPRELTRNPFAVDLERFPPAEGPDDSSEEPPEPAGGDPGEAIREAAGELVLQSTIYSDQPLACISGQVLRRGQEIAGFVVKSIEPTRVVLWRDGTEVVLNLK